MSILGWGMNVVSFQMGLPSLHAQATKVVFQDGADSSGINHFFLTSGTPEKKYIVEAMSGGVCLVDFDDDGFLDIYLVNGGTLKSFKAGTKSSLKNALFRNLGKRRFIDVTVQARVGGNGYWGMGCSAADYNADGKIDLYLTTYGPNILYQNQGDGTFVDVTDRAGVNDRRWSTGSTWADFDHDGDLDLFVANYLELDPHNLPEPGSVRYGGMGSATLGCQLFGIPVMCGPSGLKGASDSFFRNNGDGTFEEVAEKLGMHDPRGYYGLGAIWCDFDNDMFPDLYVANDSNPNYLYHNRGDGSFEEIGLLSGSSVNEHGLEQAGMGVACGDYLNEGRLSIYVTNTSREYNTLYRNEGGNNFTDLTLASGLTSPSLPFVGWGTFFFDYDNDGWLDIFVANGHIYPQVNKLERVSVAGYPQRNLVFKNLREGRFEEVGQMVGLESAAVTRGAAYGDLDNDGALDIIVNNLDGRPNILWNLNPSDNNFLMLKLASRSANRNAIGARVRLENGGEWQMREVQSGGSYLSHNDLRVHFGLGPAEKAEIVEIHWPDGKISRLKDLAANQILVVTDEQK